MDEEENVGDGVEGQKAQEASAGNRRAIADADQAGQLDISGETLREWHTTRHMFHSEIGARSASRIEDEVLRTIELW